MDSEIMGSEDYVWDAVMDTCSFELCMAIHVHSGLQSVLFGFQGLYLGSEGLCMGSEWLCMGSEISILIAFQP
eukprot:1341399-Amorphochlora_amoeboformis.AAC.1